MYKAVWNRVDEPEPVRKLYTDCAISCLTHLRSRKVAIKVLIVQGSVFDESQREKTRKVGMSSLYYFSS